MKDFISSLHPMNGTNKFAQELERQLQVGAKMLPEYPCKNISQSFYELKKALGIASSSFRSISPNKDMCTRDHFIVGVDAEKIIEAGFTGLNAEARDLMSTRVKRAGGTSIPAGFGNKMHIAVHSDNILEMREAGCQLFD